MLEVSHRVRVERSLGSLAQLLGARPAEWLNPFATIAAHAGELAAKRLVRGPRHGPRRARRVHIELADPSPGDEAGRVEVGVVWETSGFRWVFPQMTGRMVAVQEGPGSALISIEGSYRTPAVAGGEAAELAAETAAATLLTLIRDAVEEQARTRV